MTIGEIIIIAIGILIFIRVWLSQLGLWKLAEKQHKEVVNKFDFLHDVRLSCYREVWQNWCDSKSTEDFDKWLHDKMHEA